jgi:hypothetical protein
MACRASQRCTSSLLPLDLCTFVPQANLTLTLPWLHAQAETLVAARQRHGSAFGTSTALEKRYLRLTAAPTADTVRPPHVLERALAALKDKWQQVRMRGEGQ